MTDVLDATVMVVLITSSALAVARLVRPGTNLPDRVLGSDALIVTVAALVVAGTAIADRAVFLPVAVAISLLGLVGTITVARYVERRGTQP